MTMNFRKSLLFFTLALLYLTVVIGSEERKCDTSDLTIRPTCQKNEICVSILHPPNSGVCQCNEGYMRNRNNQSECIPNPIPIGPSPASTVPASPEHAKMVHHSSVSTGAITAAVLVPLMLAAGGLLVLVGRRYHWFERLQLLQGRRYEEVRIGQEDDEDDDPPLA